MTRRSFARVYLMIAGSLVAAAFVHDAGAESAGGQLVNAARNGLAIKGYDPVTYFEGGPAHGSAAFEYELNGVRYRFVSATNRDRFSKDPARFVPQYGGFCSYAVSRGYTADIDPLAWAVVDGRLYLNYSKRVQRLWQEDVPGNIRKADENWPGLREKAR